MFKLVIELINNNINLLNVNKSYIIKTKNRKSTIIQTKRTKIKFIKRDFFDFKYINIAIKVLYNSKDIIERNNNRDKAKQRK